jgi:hypothetical protein
MPAVLLPLADSREASGLYTNALCKQEDGSRYVREPFIITAPLHKLRLRMSGNPQGYRKGSGDRK